MTLTLAAVYVPIAFTEGRTGQLFIEFALTLAGAVLVSGFVALTLTPMMCGKLLRHNENQGRISRALERFLDSLNENYRRALGLAMRHKLIVLTGAAATAFWPASFMSICRVSLPRLKTRCHPYGRHGSGRLDASVHTALWPGQRGNSFQHT